MIQAVEIYELHKSTWSGDEYDPIEDSCVGTYRRRYLAEKEKERLEIEEGAKDSWGSVHYNIKSKLIRPDELDGQGLGDYQYRPSNFRHLEEVEGLPDTCGIIRDLYSSETLSLAHISLSGKAERHRHSVMEEVYFVVSGNGYLNIDEEKYRIEEGDIVSIPKEKWHFLETDENEQFEVLVITHPRFSSDDVFVEQES